MPIGEKQKLITDILSTILDEPAHTYTKFDWFINKHSEEHFGKYYNSIDEIFKSLGGGIEANKSKRTTSLACDAYFSGKYNFIFEFDEFQHFSSYRLQTIINYPSELKLNFSLESWVELCQIHRHKADQYRRRKVTKDFNFIGGRTAQRAYLDCFRDFLPEIHRLNPTLRINEFEVPNITKADKSAYRRMEELLKNKLSRI